MRIGTGIAVALTLLGTLTASASAATQLDLPSYRQRQSQWCWAAVSQAIRKHNKGEFRNQCVMASSLIAKSSDPNFCCSEGGLDPSPARMSRCNKPYNTARALQWNGVLGDSYSQALPDRQMRYEIDAGRPVGVAVQWDRGGGHAMIVYGYGERSGRSYYHLWNPNRGSSFLPRSSLVRYQDAGNWEYTFTSSR